MWHAGEGMGWWMVVGSVWFVLFWGVVVWLFFSIVPKSGGGAGTEETALEILKRRYARGEISKDDFDRMRQDLS